MTSLAGRGKVNATSVWPDFSLKSPETGRLLYRDGDFLSDEASAERWPVVEEIPYLRTGRKRLKYKVCELLERGEREAALVELLRDQDDWAPTPPPERPEVETVVSRAVAGGSAREAMTGLGFGAVAYYFAYRLSDPTYLAGLALMQKHWNEPESSFELACGIGHYTRELSRRGVLASAGDVVFAKLWLARRFVIPEARLVCFDASRGFPLPDASADLVLCQDAFYFLPDKLHVARELGRISGPEGTILVGHSHNAEVENFSAGEPVSPYRHAELFPNSTFYDDEELTQALISDSEPEDRSVQDLSNSEAICLARSGSRESEATSGSGPNLPLPPAGTPLYPSPLYRREEIGGAEHLRLEWPSERYREEYARRSFYLPQVSEAESGLLEAARSRGVGASPEIDRLARMKVLVDTPEKM